MRQTMNLLRSSASVCVSACWPVGKAVGNVKNEGAGLIERIELPGAAWCSPHAGMPNAQATFYFTNVTTNPVIPAPMTANINANSAAV
jgi:hypothetical protein